MCDSITKDYFDLWLNLESFVPIAIDCWTDNMKLVFNNETKLSEDAPGVDIKVPSFGGTESVKWNIFNYKFYRIFKEILQSNFLMH
jgi:hypothetical protein